MDENIVRKIVRDEMNKNYYSGSPDVPRHFHNGVDGVRIPIANIDGSISVYNTNMAQIVKVNEKQSINGQTTVFPLPVVKSGGVGPDGQFLGGTAEEGTVLLFYNPVGTTQIWAYLGSQWYGADLTLTP